MWATLWSSRYLAVVWVVNVVRVEMMAVTLSCSTSFFTTSAPRPGSNPSSYQMNLTLRPFMPPAALVRSMSLVTMRASSLLLKTCEKPLLIGKMPPMVIVEDVTPSSGKAGSWPGAAGALPPPVPGAAGPVVTVDPTVALFPPTPDPLGAEAPDVAAPLPAATDAPGVVIVPGAPATSEEATPEAGASSPGVAASP